MNDKLLKDFKPGEKGLVKKLTVTGALRRRLLDMGITPGTEILMKKTAPLGDPLELVLRGYNLAVGKAEAEAVLMELRETQ